MIKMKKIFLFAFVLTFAASVVYAQQALTPVASVLEETVTVSGYVVDNLCAGPQKTEDLAVFVQTHTKECALAPSCAASGYAIFAEGQLLKFDQESSAKVSEFLKKADSTLKVIVEAKKGVDGLALISIKNG